MFRRLFSKDASVSAGSTNHVGLVYVDAENCTTHPQDLMSIISEHNGSKPSETYAYSKWSARSTQTKKYRTAGFRLLQADSGDNNADIMMCLDAYQRVRDLSDNGISGNVYICFHGDKGFTHLLEKLRAINGWNSVWVTSNTKPNEMIENSASVTLRVSVPEKKPIKKSPVNHKDTTISDSRKNDTGNNTELRELMLKLIGEEEIKSSSLGAKIIEYQKSNGWSETGKQAFNEKFGIPKSQSYLATISEHLSTEIEILGWGAATSYKTKVQSQSPQKEPIKKSPVSQKDTTIADSGKKDTGNDTELRELMLKLIGEEEIKSSSLGTKIIEYQKSNGWSETGKQALNEKFGLPKAQSYLTTISKLFSTEIEIFGTGMSTSYKRKVSSQSPKKEAIKKSSVNQKDTTIADSGEDLERIIGFNTSGKGLRFPLDPNTLANILLVNSEFEEEISKKERADVISEKLGVSRTRVFVVLTRLLTINLMKTESSLEAVKGLRQRFESSYNELGDWSPEEVEKIQQYFARAQENLE